MRPLAFAAVAVAALAGQTLAADAKAIRDEALSLAKATVPQAMKDPDSARFDPDAVSVKKLPGDRFGEEGEVFYLVTGVVRGKNSFGAVVPSEWAAIVREEGEGKYSAEVAFLEGDSVGLGPRGNEVLAKIDQTKAKARQEREDRYRKSIEEAGSRERRAKEAIAEEHARQIAKWKTAGQNAAEAVAAKAGQNVRQMTNKDIAKKAKRAALLEGLNVEEEQAFVEGFTEAINAAKAASRSKDR